jgi:predicted RNase H-like HicB family nuclease
MTFTVVYEPDEGGWLAQVPEVQGCLTWGRTLEAARRNIREALSTCSDVFDEPDKVARDAELVDDVRLPRDAKKALEAARTARAKATDAATSAKDATEHAAKALVRDVGLSLRDAGELLGLSHERVKQTLAAAEPKRKKTASRAARMARQ